MAHVEHEFTIVREGKTIELYAKASGYYDPGSYCGPLDGSYPAEGEITELEILDADGNGWTGSLTEEESTKLDDALMEKIMEAQSDHGE